MTCRILCPGPSLGAYEDDFEGMVIAVNRAAIAVRCDAWCAGDEGIVAKWGNSVSGSPRLFSKMIPASGWRGSIQTWDSLEGFLSSNGDDWPSFSLTAAVVLAASAGADVIEIFGCDWTEAPDFDGNSDALENRQPHRWERERAIFERTRRRLSPILIRRCGVHN